MSTNCATPQRARFVTRCTLPPHPTTPTRAAFNAWRSMLVSSREKSKDMLRLSQELKVSGQRPAAAQSNRFRRDDVAVQFVVAHQREEEFFPTAFPPAQQP